MASSRLIRRQVSTVLLRAQLQQVQRSDLASQRQSSRGNEPPTAPGFAVRAWQREQNGGRAQSRLQPLQPTSSRRVQRLLPRPPRRRRQAMLSHLRSQRASARSRSARRRRHRRQAAPTRIESRPAEPYRRPQRGGRPNHPPVNTLFVGNLPATPRVRSSRRSRISYERCSAAVEASDSFRSGSSRTDRCALSSSKMCTRVQGHVGTQRTLVGWRDQERRHTLSFSKNPLFRMNSNRPWARRSMASQSGLAPLLDRRWEHSSVELGLGERKHCSCGATLIREPNF